MFEGNGRFVLSCAEAEALGGGQGICLRARCSEGRSRCAGRGLGPVVEATGRHSLAQGSPESGKWAENQPGRNSHT